MLEINNLHVSIGNKEILHGLNLKVELGQVHAIMGPNGSGKSTLANVLAGRKDFTVTDGTVKFEEQNLLEMEIDERARAGIFLAFQYPIEIPGVTNIQFLKTALNVVRKSRGEEPLDAVDFLEVIKAKVKEAGMSEQLLYRSVNEGFSGGEKKRNEVLQMSLLEPKLAILDETDSGLDIDALQAVAAGVNALRDPKRSILLITHYQRLLNYIQPDYVHVLAHGKIVKSGGRELAQELEKKGYGWLTTHAETA